MIRFCLALIFILCIGQPVAALELDGRFTQGGFVVGHASPGSRVLLGDRSIKVAPDGLFVIGFGRDEPGHVQLTVIDKRGKSEQRQLTIEPRSYDIQRIDRLDQSKVTPDEEGLARIKSDQDMINAARASITDERDFLEGFIWPAQGPISGVYGSQRILNGEPRQPHFGVDVVAPEGSLVIAPAGGVVRLAETDFFLTGGTVILDHGFGLNSTFIHMKSVAVKVGQHLKQGDPIGAVGQTGRATGPHLHWGMNWLDVRLDPALLVPPMPSN